MKLGLINYTLLDLIEPHGVFINSGHYVSYIRHNNKCVYHYDDKHITETIYLGLINYTLLDLIEHHGVSNNSGHYFSYIRQKHMVPL